MPDFPPSHHRRGIDVRQATPGDLAWLKHIQNRPASRDAGYVHPAAMLERISRGEVLLATLNGDPAAYIIASRRADRRCNIPQVVVDEQCWRIGIGSALFEHARIAAAARGDYAIVLKTAYGAAANHFWPALGMTPVATMAGQRRPLLAWCLPLAQPGLVLPPHSRRSSSVLTCPGP